MVIDRLPNNMLSSEFGDIKLSSVVGYVNMDVVYNGVTVLSERFTPNSFGYVTIKNIGTVVNNLADIPDISNLGFSFSPPVILNIKLTEKNAAPVDNLISFYVSNVITKGTVDHSNIFSIPLCLSNEKRTGLGRKEIISFRLNFQQTVNIYVVHKSTSEDKGLTVTNYISGWDSSLGCFAIDVSPSKIATRAGCAESDIIYYNVYTSSANVIKYVMCERQYPHLRTFAFINSFYAQETFHSLEAGGFQTKYDRLSGSLSGVRSQFNTKAEKLFTVNTGYLKRAEIQVLEDLLTSQRVGVWENGEFVPVTIETDSIKISDRKDELISVEFGYRYADERYKRHVYVSRSLAGIFDKSFDLTFN